MGKILHALFDGIFKHIGQFFEHIHWPEWMIPRAIFITVRKTYNEYETLWNVLGCIILILISVYLIQIVIKKRQTKNIEP